MRTPDPTRDSPGVSAVCLIQPNLTIPGYYHVYVRGDAVPKVAASEGEAISRARHLVSRNGGWVWVVDSTGFPAFVEIVEATGDTGLRGGGAMSSGQL